MGCESFLTCPRRRGFAHQTEPNMEYPRWHLFWSSEACFAPAGAKGAGPRQASALQKRGARAEV
jgi:hypothetical protein